MTAWTPADLDTIGHTADLYVSPVRDDGVTYGTPDDIAWGCGLLEVVWFRTCLPVGCDRSTP